MGFEKNNFEIGKKKKPKKSRYKIELIGKGICAIGKEYGFIAPNIFVAEDKSIELDLLSDEYIELRNNRSLKIQRIGV